MLQPVSIRIATTMTDSTKGSFTNRTQCTKEHIKNDCKATLKLGLVGGGVAATAINPSFTEKVATYVGKVFAKIYSGAAKLVGMTKLKNGSLAEYLTKVSEFTTKNAKKAGLVGLAATGVALVASALVKHAYKEGQIDQKYTDAAKIEAKSKNIILEQEENLKSAQIIDNNA
jgi:hypothetical protein